MRFSSSLKSTISETSFNGSGLSRGSLIVPFEQSYPDSSSGHWNNYASLFFKYENESEFEKAGDLLKNFTQTNISPYDGATISLISWNNKKYMSWMME